MNLVDMNLLSKWRKMTFGEVCVELGLSDEDALKAAKEARVGLQVPAYKVDAYYCLYRLYIRLKGVRV